MITVIAEHWVKPGQNAKAEKIFTEVSASAKKAPGFVSRYVIVSQQDPSKMTTVTNWKTQNDFDQWKKVRKFSFGPEFIHEAFSKEVGEFYNVVKTV